jgi:hypothetical protein
MVEGAADPGGTSVQSRLCFVIMPFSTTDSCTEDKWTWIFEEILKPAVENAGLNYACRRSAATRGNVVAAIMEALRDAYVVVADLTDQNPNVFYELGVRHALKNRTILIAQDKKFIPFDLRPYAYHVYKWKTKQGRQRLATRLRELLADVDQSPDRSDNPVSDFLRGHPPAAEAATPPSPHARPRAPQQAPGARALVGPASKDIDALELGSDLATRRAAPSVRAVVRETRSFFSREWPRLIEKLNLEVRGGAQVAGDRIYEHCLSYIQRFSPDAERVEQFGLALVDAEYEEGLAHVFRILEDWINLSQQYWRPGSLRAVRGAPALLAFRALANWGAKAADDMSVDILRFLLTHPLETIESTGQPATLPLVDRRDLFWPEGFFGRADLAVQYIRTESWGNDGLQRMFASQQDHLDGLSRFLFTAALIYDATHPDDALPLYPGFKLLPGAWATLTAFAGRLSADPTLIEALAKAVGEDAATFRSRWPQRVRRLNDAPLGGRYDILLDWQRIPEEL